MRDYLKKVEKEEGATMIEYALMLALIAVVCIVAVTALGNAASQQFDTMATTIN